ncbi:MAG TPA: T9SS type A sorting domain-containing protein [Bacteroidia bacterium]|nr:T9SS type A sorting domain-containing protein [Bacteroidia bacterium]
MKKSTSSKLKSYTALAGSMTAVAITAHGQIIYTDINPDTIVHDSITYDLDMDNNATPELQFKVGVSTTPPNYPFVYASVVLNSPSTNAIISSVQGNYAYPMRFNSGDTIQPSSPSWVDYATHPSQYLGSVYGSALYGNFRGQGDKFMGVRFDIGGQNHYGWVRLYVSAGADTIIIRDYAYEAIADSAIIAGQTSSPLGISAGGNDGNIRVHSFENSIFVHTGAQNPDGKVTVYNSTGQVVREEEVTAADMHISMEGQATGVYFVRVVDGTTAVTRKVYIR